MKKALISILTLTAIICFVGCSSKIATNNSDIESNTFDEATQSGEEADGNESVGDTSELQATAEPTTAPTEAPTEAPTKAPTAVPTEAPKNNNDTSVSADFKATMDSYEKFFNEYVDFMKKYKSSNNPLSMMSDYTKMMAKYTEMYSNMSKIDSSSLSAADYKYYVEVHSRIMNKLAEVV